MNATTSFHQAQWVYQGLFFLPPHQELLQPDALCLQLVCLMGPFSWTQYLRTSRTEFLVLTSQITFLVTSLCKGSKWHHCDIRIAFLAIIEQHNSGADADCDVWPVLRCLCPSSVLQGRTRFVDAFLATSTLEALFTTQNSLAVQIFGSRGLSWRVHTAVKCESGHTWLWARLDRWAAPYDSKEVFWRDPSRQGVRLEDLPFASGVTHPPLSPPRLL